MDVLEWKKPTITFYRERVEKPETDPFAVIRAQKLSLEEKEGEFKGVISDFFTLMGDIDYISSPNGKSDRYVLCWFDDNIKDFNEAFRKVRGVTFPSGLSYTTKEGKRTYNASFQAKEGKVQ